MLTHWLLIRLIQWERSVNWSETRSLWWRQASLGLQQQCIHMSPLSTLLKAIILVCVTYDLAPSVTPSSSFNSSYSPCRLPSAMERSGLPQLKAFWTARRPFLTRPGVKALWFPTWFMSPTTTSPPSPYLLTPRRDGSISTCSEKREEMGGKKKKESRGRPCFLFRKTKAIAVFSGSEKGEQEEEEEGWDPEVSKGRMCFSTHKKLKRVTSWDWKLQKLLLLKYLTSSGIDGASSLESDGNSEGLNPVWIRKI